jgi:hypothetical protein
VMTISIPSATLTRASTLTTRQRAGCQAHSNAGEFELTDYINAWESLPPLKPPVAIDDGDDQIEEIDPERPQA